ncbi:MAG: type II toxin-antitoxin system VapC family toxin [Solirubrobacterales bacterium]
MRLLLDTDALIWALSWPDRLSKAAAGAIRDPENDVFVSITSPWEIAIKKALGKLRAPDDLESQLHGKRITLLPITLRHARAIESLPHHHGDPFDRMLIAQAQIEGLTIVTSDRQMQLYQVALLPAT